ncbi:hypothetical protein GE107_16075 [Cohnella sp. CFH 77786]|uniref:hypothetical protein n=1 Tax=Cohnella sp. CFH 77786 TaxID=2662265 RepID=UPI001C6106BA|nr:hypothetical protein [Cohnella sp. CFH 77786]MBW5447575.1 hypothetical protein [Cohnella sp. CFH 77786]
MKRTLLIGALILACQMLFAGMASAAKYSSSDDKYVNLNVPVSLPKTNTGSLTFDTQQSLYTNVINPALSPTGVDYNYYYCWVTVNGDPVIAVDPAKFAY